MTQAMRLSVAEAFKFFDDDGDGKLTSAEAIIMVQSLGHSPTHAQLQRVGFLTRRMWSLAQMQAIVRDAFPRHKNPSAAIIDAFKYYNATFRGMNARQVDGELVVDDRDEIPVEDLEHLMTQLGDVLNATEWINMKAKAEDCVSASTGYVNYRRLVLGIC